MTQPAPSSGMDLTKISPQDIVKLAGLIGQNPEALRALHQLSDVDFSTDSQHHTLGRGPGEAAPGNHLHNGTDSLSMRSIYGDKLAYGHYSGSSPIQHSGGNRFINTDKIIPAGSLLQLFWLDSFGNLALVKWWGYAGGTTTVYCGNDATPVTLENGGTLADGTGIQYTFIYPS